MATNASSNSIDLGKLVSAAAKLEVQLVSAGVESAQLWINQAARLSSIASDTLKAVQDDKASLADTARRLTEFGRQNTQAYSDLSIRLSKTYYDELDKLASNALSNTKSEPKTNPKQEPASPKPARSVRRISKS